MDFLLRPSFEHVLFFLSQTLLELILRGRPKTTLTRFWHILTTYLPLVDISDGFSLILYSKIHVSLTFHILPTFLPPLVNAGPYEGIKYWLGTQLIGVLL